MKDILKIEVDEFLKFYIEHHIEKALKYVNHVYESDGGRPLQDYAKGKLNTLLELKAFLETSSSSVNYTTLRKKYKDSLTSDSEDT